MSKATYWQRGESLDYSNKTDAVIPANTIIDLPSVIGVAGTDIEPGAVGSILVEGIFEIPKDAETAIEMGAAVFFDGTKIVDKTGDGCVPAGYAAAPAVASATTVLVKING